MKLRDTACISGSRRMHVIDIGLRFGVSCARASARVARRSRPQIIPFNNNVCLSCVRTAAVNAGDQTASNYCVDLVRKYDYENYLALLLLPKSLRRTAFAVRAFNVELAQIKDVVSTQAIGDMRIQFWRDALERIYSGRPPQQPVALELARAIRTAKLSKHWLRRLIDCRGARLSDQPFDSMQEIENYAENSASSIYYLLLESLSLKNVNVDHAASHVGKAQGVTNFVRGIPHQLKQQKLLLPNDVMIKHKMSHEQVLRGVSERQLQNVVFDIASVAHHHVEMARNLKKNVPESAFVLFLPLISTEQYLIALQKADFNPLNSKLHARNAWIPCKLWWSKLCRRY